MAKKKTVKIPYIGVIRSEFREAANHVIMKEKVSTIIVDEEFEEGLFKVEHSTFLEVYFHFHKAEPFKLKTHNFSGQYKGVFATRSPNRPSELGSTIVKLIQRKGKELQVTGLDAIDGTPVVDIKPFFNTLDKQELEEAALDNRRMNPRKEIMSAVWSGNTGKLLLDAARFHGHFCPGLAMGIMMGVRALQIIRANADGLEDLLAIVQANNCSTDGIQFVTGCTFGNNALIFKDVGKTAFTLTKRDGSGVRISVRAGGREYMHQAFPQFSESYKKVVAGQNHSDEELAKFKKLGIQKAFAVLGLDFDKLFKIDELQVQIPDYAPSHESVICALCGEPVMATRIVEKDGQRLCIPCAGTSGNSLTGHGIIATG